MKDLKKDLKSNKISPNVMIGSIIGVSEAAFLASQNNNTVSKIISNAFKSHNFIGNITTPIMATTISVLGYKASPNVVNIALGSVVAFQMLAGDKLNNKINETPILGNLTNNLFIGNSSEFDTTTKIISGLTYMAGIGIGNYFISQNNKN